MMSAQEQERGRRRQDRRDAAARRDRRQPQAYLTDDEAFEVWAAIDLEAYSGGLGDARRVIDGAIGGRFEAVRGVLAEMERHGTPDTRYYYGSKLRSALGVTGNLECTCGTCSLRLPRREKDPR